MAGGWGAAVVGARIAAHARAWRAGGRTAGVACPRRAPAGLPTLTVYFRSVYTICSRAASPRRLALLPPLSEAWAAAAAGGRSELCIDAASAQAGTAPSSAIRGELAGCAKVC